MTLKGEDVFNELAKLDAQLSLKTQNSMPRPTYYIESKGKLMNT